MVLVSFYCEKITKSRRWMQNYENCITASLDNITTHKIQKKIMIKIKQDIYNLLWLSLSKIIMKI